jgi:hypothetical protein
VCRFVCVYFVTNDRITNPLTHIAGQLVTERNVVPLLSTGKLDNGHCDALLSVEERGRVNIFEELCLYRQPLTRAFL